MQDGNLRLAGNRELLFEDNGQIRTVDETHKLVFNRAGNLLELHGAGDIRFLTGGQPPSEKLRIRSDGAVGIGTDTPAERLHVAGNVYTEGSLCVTGVTSLEGSLEVAGAAASFLRYEGGQSLGLKVL